MYKTVKFWVWVAVALIVLLLPPSLFFRTRTGWVTVAYIDANLPPDTMCPMAIQENMRGFPAPAYMSYGTNGCSAPYKKINLIGLPIDLIVAYGIVRIMFVRKNGKKVLV